MKNKITKKTGLIVFSLLFSFLFSHFLIKNAFIAQSPRINPLFIAQLKRAPQKIPQYLASLPQLIFKPSSQKRPSLNQIEKIAETVEMKPVAKGVYAGEKANIKFYKIKESDVDWEEMSLRTKSGKIIKLRYPKGQPPLKEIIEIIKSE